MATHSPSCPRTESGPAFTFSFFSGLPFGPSRPFLFESLFLPFALLPDPSVPGKERAGGRQLPGEVQPKPRSLRTILGVLAHLLLTFQVTLPC